MGSEMCIRDRHSPVSPSSAFSLSSSDMSAIQNDLELSNTRTLKLAGHLRSASCSRKCVQPNLKTANLQIINHKLDDLFSVESADFVVQQDGDVAKFAKKTFVFCNDLNLLLETAQQSRERTYDSVKIGIDGGGGSLKFCATLHNSSGIESGNQRRHRYVDGIQTGGSDGSVKKLFLIAIAPDVPENYRNVLYIWTRLRLDEIRLPFTLAMDLKLANLVLGLMAHGSNHPCTWCQVSKDNLLSGRRGESRTFGSLRKSFWEWYRAGAKLSDAKHFGNVIHLPLPKNADSSFVINTIPPPELHLLIGPVTTIFVALKNEWPQAEEWADTSNVERQSYHGGTFNGNGCMRLLKKLHILVSSIIEMSSKIFECL